MWRLVGCLNKDDGKGEQRIRQWMLTIACDITVLVLGHGEKRRPFGEVVHVEVNVVVLGESIKICEIHFEQVLWLKGTQGSHGSEA